MAQNILSKVELIVALAEGQPIHTVEWLIDGVIPFGSLSVFDGDPGQGKSFLTLELAAAVSRGQTLGPKGRCRLHAGRRHVVVMNAEDDVNTTMVPRLIGLGAELKNISFCSEGNDTAGRRAGIYFPDDTAKVAYQNDPFKWAEAVFPAVHEDIGRYSPRFGKEIDVLTEPRVMRLLSAVEGFIRDEAGPRAAAKFAAFLMKYDGRA